MFEPPDHLSAKSAALWRSIVPSRARSPGRLALIQTALESLDRADAARAEVDRHGMVTITKTSGVMHMSPMLRVEREARQQFAKIWHDLNLQWDPALDGLRGPALERHLALQRANAARDMAHAAESTADALDAMLDDQEFNSDQ